MKSVSRGFAPVRQAPAPDEGGQDDVSGRVTLGLLSQSFFRGLHTENGGVIAHNTAELGFHLFEDRGETLSSVDLVLGAFNALHSGPSGTSGNATSPPSAWNENDVYVGLNVGIHDKWQLGMVYTILNSPNNSFPTRQELGLSVSYDDSDSWSDLENFKGLQPSATIAFELDGQADGGSDEGIYFQLGINPAYQFTIGDDHPVTASMPITLGLGSDFYELAGSGDDSLGYVDIGLAFSTPLSIVPERFGSWDVSVSMDVLFLGDNQEIRNGGDSVEVIGAITIGLDF